jgi:hypothetical protein
MVSYHVNMTQPCWPMMFVCTCACVRCTVTVHGVHQHSLDNIFALTDCLPWCDGLLPDRTRCCHAAGTWEDVQALGDEYQVRRGDCTRNCIFLYVLISKPVC